MSRLLPSLPDSEPDDREPRVVDVDDDDAGELISALSSETARKLLATLHEEPATTSELADELDTSLQNVQYHLRNLSDADLVDVVDTAYSEKGREMDVYAAADEPLVLFSGGSTSSGGIRTALKRLLGGYVLIGLASLIVQRLLAVGAMDDAEPPETEFADDDVGDAPEEEPEAAPVEDDVEDVADEPVGVGDRLLDSFELVADQLPSLLDPGVVFFLGAALVFTVVWAYWYRRDGGRVR